ncbi:MAG TPA: SUMF1/EgtB/PvdO family nonheme iron enzyme [Solirubrobacteraceae bacterium]|jgi:iron(II)-dependent oxidoreductase|nr:SUMF1/EgtB/PvdO family nonheme iron enzyme [Solirubrobacteraceae bacterium]
MSTTSSLPTALIDSLVCARARTLALTGAISGADLERSHSAIMSPLVWDLAHIAAYEDLWLVHRHGERELLHPELAELYDAFETPRAVRADLPLLSHEQSLDYMQQVRQRTFGVIDECGVDDGVLHEMVACHERQHLETMLQTIELAELTGWAPGEDLGPGAVAAHTGLETVEVPAGPGLLGAPRGRFCFDNELPRREIELPSFRIGRTPVTNATWLTFAEGGGYERREWWSDEGWAWKEEYDIERPAGWRLDPDGGSVQEWRRGAWEALRGDRPVIHISWFEADAFARAHGVRLPTEAQWEKAATWDQQAGTARAWPWGPQAPDPTRANLIDEGPLGTLPVGVLPASASPCGALGMIGDVWEWTSSEFGGYPGFRSHPYREYSEVFFDRGYRVLRGGSWATSAAVGTATFRNWDLPQRRQIFAGLRIASA